jgi:hypothetical protein
MGPLCGLANGMGRGVYRAFTVDYTDRLVDGAAGGNASAANHLAGDLHD